MKHYFSIGQLNISLEYEPRNYTVFLEKAVNAFSAAQFEHPDIRFQIDTTSPFPKLDSYRQICSSNPTGSWSIFEDSEKSQYIISLQHDERGESPYKIVRVDRKFADVVIYSRFTMDGLLRPLEYPLDQLAISGHLNINKLGLILHSAVISLNGKALLFSGVSGAGKSTISELWQKDGEAEVLTDERVIIREYHGDLWAFGTPWHGTSEIYKNSGAPIKKIFFIKHGNENRAIPISKTHAANRLMVRCFPTFWNREGMQFAVNFCSKVAESKECYELEFVNDLSVTEFLKDLANQGAINK